MEKLPTALMRQVSPKGRYLLFDSECSVCTEMARSAEWEAGGWLTSRSLREPEMQELLSQARSNWRWEPTLLEVDQGEVLAFSGLSMRVRMLFGLGPRRAARVARMVRSAAPEGFEIELSAAPSTQGDQQSYSIEKINPIDRRTALKTMGVMGLGVALLPLSSSGSAFAQSEASTETSDKKLEARFLEGPRLKRAIDGVRENADGNQLWAFLLEDGFEPSEDKAQGSTVTSPALSTKATVVTVPFYHQDGRKALIFFSRNGNDSKSDVSIFNVDDSIHVYATVGQQVQRVQSIEDPQAVRDRLAVEKDGEVTSRAVSRCSVCRIAANVIIAAGCGLYGSTIVGLACSVFVPLSPAFFVCAGLAGALYGVVCTGVTVVSSPRAACRRIGAC